VWGAQEDSKIRGRTNHAKGGFTELLNSINTSEHVWSPKD